MESCPVVSVRAKLYFAQIKDAVGSQLFHQVIYRIAKVSKFLLFDFSILNQDFGVSPDQAAENGCFFSVKTDRMTSKHMRVKIGIMPRIRGTSLFSIGRVAMLEIKMVMTSSEGCNWPSWRFPIMRIPKMTTMYKMSVLKKETSIKPLSFQIFMQIVSV